MVGEEFLLTHHVYLMRISFEAVIGGNCEDFDSKQK